MLSRRLTHLHAKKVAKEIPECTGFLSSLGWLDKFLKRNRLNLRSTTTTCQRPPVDSIVHPQAVPGVQLQRIQRVQGRAQELAEGGGGGCGKSQMALLLKIFLGTGQPHGLLYLIHWEAQPQAKPINRNDFQVNRIIEV